MWGEERGQLGEGTGVTEARGRGSNTRGDGRGSVWEGEVVREVRGRWSGGASDVHIFKVIKVIFSEENVITRR